MIVVNREILELADEEQVVTIGTAEKDGEQYIYFDRVRSGAGGDGQTVLIRRSDLAVLITRLKEELGRGSH